MDIRQLRYFVGVVEAGSVSRAAVQLNVAQSAVSQHIRRLEAEIKAQLLIRGSTGVAPTTAGEILYKHARSILRHMQVAKDDVRTADNSPSGRVAVGFPSALSALLSYRLFERTRTTFPNIELKLVDGVSSHLRELLQNDRLDIALLFLNSSERGIHVNPLVIEELFYVSGQYAKPTIKLAEVVKRPIMLPSRTSTVTETLEVALQEKGLSIQRFGEFDSMSTLMRAALDGTAATILPWSALQGFEQSANLNLARVSDASLTRCISLCMPGSSDWSQAASSVAALLADEMQTIVKQKKWFGAKLVPAPRQRRSPKA